MAAPALSTTRRSPTEGERIEQAIFTSRRGAARDGYQLVTASAGLTREEARELSAWGPAHDALRPLATRAAGVNFHRLENGACCVGRCSFQGDEYSGRGGRRVFTHWLVVPPKVLARFGNHPFRLLEAATATCGLRTDETGELTPLTLIGRAGAFRRHRLGYSHHLPAVLRMLPILDALLQGERVAVDVRFASRDLADGLFDLLPPVWRPRISFCTGLRYSARRPFQLMILDQMEWTERRQLERAGYNIQHWAASSEPCKSNDHGSNDHGSNDHGSHDHGSHHRWTRLLHKLAQRGGMRSLGRLLRRVSSQAAY